MDIKFGSRFDSFGDFFGVQKTAEDLDKKEFKEWMKNKHERVQNKNPNTSKVTKEISYQTFLSQLVEENKNDPNKKWVFEDYAKFQDEFKKDKEKKDAETKKQLKEKGYDVEGEKEKKKKTKSRTEVLEKANPIAEYGNMEILYEKTKDNLNEQLDALITDSDLKESISKDEKKYKEVSDKFGLSHTEVTLLSVMDDLKHTIVSDGKVTTSKGWDGSGEALSFDDALTLEVNKSIPAKDYGMEGIVKSMVGKVNLFNDKDADNIIKELNEEFGDFSARPMEVLTKISTGQPLIVNDNVREALISSIMNKMPAVKLLIAHAPNLSLDSNDNIQYGKMTDLLRGLELVDKQKYLPKEQRIEALSNLKPLSLKPLSKEEADAFNKTLEELGLDDKSEVAQYSDLDKREFLKSFFEQKEEAAKALLSSKDPGALKNMVSAMRSEVNGAGLAIDRIMLGSFSQVGDVIINPHLYSVSDLDKREKELNDVFKSIDKEIDALKEWHLGSAEDIDILSQKESFKQFVSDINKLNLTPEQIDDYLDQQHEDLSTALDPKNKGKYTKEEIDDIKERVQMLQMFSSKTNKLMALEEKRNEVEKQIRKQGEIRAKIKEAHNKLEEVNTKVKDFKTAHPITGEKIGFEEALALNNFEALDLKKQMLQGKQYKGMSFKEALASGDKEAMADRDLMVAYHAKALEKVEELEKKENKTTEESAQLTSLKRMTRQNLSPQQQALNQVANFISNSYYNPERVTKGLNSPEKRAGALHKEYSTLGSNELVMVEEQIRKQIAESKDDSQKEQLEEAISTLAVIAQQKGLPLPKGRVPVDPEILKIFTDEDAIPSPRKDKALGVLMNLTKPTPTMNSSQADKEHFDRNMTAMRDVFNLMSEDALSNTLKRVDPKGAIGVYASMLDPDFCASKAGGLCTKLDSEEKANVKQMALDMFMSKVRITPNYFAPRLPAGDNYLESEFFKKKQKGLSKDKMTDPTRSMLKDNKGSSAKKNMSKWQSMLDKKMFQEIKDIEKNLKDGLFGSAVTKNWKSPEAKNLITKMNTAIKSKDSASFKKNFDQFNKVLEAENVDVDSASKKELQDVIAKIKEEKDKDEPNTTLLSTLWEKKKTLLNKAGFDVKEENPYQSGRFASQNTSFISNSLSYEWSDNIMKKQAYVDYQGLAQLYKPGMPVRHTTMGNDDAQSGIVRAVFPAIGMVDVQFPYGDQRIPVEELAIATDLPMDNLRSKATIPGGVVTQPVSAGAVRVASLYLRRKGLN